MQRLYKLKAAERGATVTIKRANAEAIQIKGENKERMQGLYKSRAHRGRRYGDNKESGRRGYTNQGPTEGAVTATIKRADAEAIQIKSPQGEALGRQ